MLIRDILITRALSRAKNNEPFAATSMSDCLNRALKSLSVARSLDGTPLPIEALKSETEIAVTASAYYATLPTDFVYLFTNELTIRDATQAWQICKVGKDKFKNWFPDIKLASASTGKPTVFYLEGTRIYWGPKSDTTYTIDFEFTKFHAQVLANVDTILFPDRYEEAIIQGMLFHFFSDLDSFDRATFHQEKFQNEILSQHLIESRNRKGALMTQYRDV